MEPTVERFRALARSSPWRWSTLRYVQKRDQSGREDCLRRVLIRRPKLARVEQLDGTLVRVHRETFRTATPLSRRGDAPSVVVPIVSDVEVELDDDGLVRRRPGSFELDADAPMVGNYYDVAMLDPVERADADHDCPGAVVQDAHVVDHHGREAWEAVLRPRPRHRDRNRGRTDGRRTVPTTPTPPMGTISRSALNCRTSRDGLGSSDQAARTFDLRGELPGRRGRHRGAGRMPAASAQRARHRR